MSRNANDALASMPSTLRWLGSEQLTVAGASIAPAAVPSGAMYARIDIETANVRMRADGTAVTPTTGIRMQFGTPEWWPAGSVVELEKMRFIREGGVSATVTITYLAN